MRWGTHDATVVVDDAQVFEQKVLKERAAVLAFQFGRDKAGNDREKVVGEFLLCATIFVFFDNQEPAIAPFADVPFADVLEEEIKGETSKSVSVGDHNLADNAAKDGVQKGSQALALEVDTGSDVGDDAVFWVLGAQEVDLSPD